MRDILFRGKRIDNDEWIVGYYINIEDFESHYDCPAIIPLYMDIYSYGEINDFAFVDPDTVGQYTRKDDSNGDNIFEGDILYNELRKVTIVVDDISKIEHLYFRSNEYTIIGNVWDNPELVEK